MSNLDFVCEHSNTNYSQKHNAINSLFFTLPPELRNRIYGLLLGNRTIHVVYTLEEGVRCAFCHLTAENEWYARTAGSPMNFMDHAFSIHSRRCCTNMDHFLESSPYLPIHPNILGTCSQIYLEAALIPFAHNTFLVSNDNDLSAFLSKLAPSQSNAIRTMHLPDAGNYNFARDNVWSKLRGLRTLHIVVRPRTPPLRHLSLNACARAEIDLRNTELRTKKGRLVFEPLKRLNLRSFHLNVIVPPRTNPSCPSITEFRIACRRIEREVLKGWDKEAQENDSSKRCLRGTMGRWSRWTRCLRGDSLKFFDRSYCDHKV